MRVSRFAAGAAFLLAMAGVTTGVAHADGRAGYEAWQRGDFETALKNWRPLAIAGDAEAQYNMGQAYRLGRGVSTDMKVAEDWFRKSALQGNDKGKAAYGITMFQNGKRAEALPYLEEAAGHGNANAQYIYGTILFNGELVPRDYPRAYAMMTRASAAGVQSASAALVRMDQVIPLPERTRGLALARAFELAESRPVMPGEAGTGAPPVASPPIRRPSGPIRTTSLPPSDPVGLPAAPEEVDPLPPLGAPPVRTTVVRTPRPPMPKPPLVKAPVAVAAGGAWRVQLGAFSNANGATALWNGLRGRVAALAPYQPLVVRAGSITRLQTGPFASRAAADKLCASVKASGQACVAVAP
jgi:uncharacterized protein